MARDRRQFVISQKRLELYFLYYTRKLVLSLTWQKISQTFSLEWLSSSRLHTQTVILTMN